MPDTIPGTGVYSWYYTLTQDDYDVLNAYNPDLLADFHLYNENGLWYALKSDIDNDGDYAAITALGIEFGEAWFTRSTEPNFFP